MNKFKSLITVFACAILLVGCSTKYGQRVVSSHYVYPNSNVVPLGYTTAEVSRVGILFPKQANKEVYEELFNQALSKHQGADIIVDMGLDVTYTQIPIPILTIWITKMNLTGTAASVEVGEQELSQIRNQNFEEVVDKFHSLDITKIR
ncbi:hypothetical protein [Gracilimonas sp.]|uniref:hypothetical protein n=1 Tax=Gracilimonas sp. TaxID=1974203 RepID=UPI003D0B17DE